MNTLPPARTYNQSHIPRTRNGQRRISIYWTWSYPWEAQRDPAAMYNRFSTMTEVRNVAVAELRDTRIRRGELPAGHRRARWNFSIARHWPSRSWPAKPPVTRWRCSSASTRPATSCRSTSGSWPTPTPSWCSGWTTSCPSRKPHRRRSAAIREWLQREGTCLLLAPHHDVGFTDDFAQRQIEYRHHGDPLVPRQQRFGQYTRSLMKALDVPVHNTWGLRPAVVDGTNDIAPLTAFRDLDTPRLLDNVTTFNFHPHLPHYELTAPEGDSVRVLGRQRIDPDRPHPFTAAGNTEFNALIWMPPAGATRRRHRAHRLHQLHHAVRRHRKPQELLAQPRHHEMTLLLRRRRPN